MRGSHAESANVYDSLGEAYAAAGEREKAIASYQRSLALDAKNSNAAAWLQKLRAGRATPQNFKRAPTCSSRPGSGTSTLPNVALGAPFT